MGYVAHNSPASRAQRTRTGRVFLRVAKAGTNIWWPQSRALMRMGWGTANIDKSCQTAFPISVRL